MKNEIVMIPIGDLVHHPENPRKDLGDISELTESIRKNGVMQNLTVVPDLEKAKYLVVIGNRRMEAAKAAGLVDLPCVVSDMDHRTQIATMLEENMQRQDLTVYEQAQGFQMMMDLGFTAKEISEKTGFSETTVSRRLKMAELDKNAFKKAVGKQITMDDLDRLGKLKSVKERNALLKEYGEDNFNWKLTRALNLQRANEVKPAAMAQIREAKLEKVPDREQYSGKYQQLYNLSVRLYNWDGKKNIIPKMSEKLYYMADEDTITFFIKPAKKKEPAVEKTEKEKEEERRIDLAWKTAERVTQTAFELRQAWVSQMKVSPKNAMEMLQWTLTAAMCMAFDYDTPTETLRKRIPINGYNTQEMVAAVRGWIQGLKQSEWPGVIFLMFEGEERYTEGYVDGTKRLAPRYRENRKLDICYEWLKAFGYKMSLEEEQMQKGTHPVFQEKIS